MNFVLNMDVIIYNQAILFNASPSNKDKQFSMHQCINVNVQMDKNRLYILTLGLVFS